MVQTAYITSISGNTTLSLDYDTYIISVSGNITLTLPDITCDGMVYTLIRTDVTKNIVTVQGTGGELINGASTFTINYKGITTLNSLNNGWTTVGTLSSSSPGGKISFTYATGTNPYITLSPGVGVNSVVTDFYYSGSNFGGGIPTMFAFVYATTSTGLFTIELIHLSGGTGVTSGSVICTMTIPSTSSTSKIITTTSATLTNISTTECIWEVRIRKNSGSGGMRVYNCYLNL